MAPADSLARLRKTLIDRAERGEAPVTELCREAGISRSRFYELRHRYRRYGEAGLRPKPRPSERPGRRLPEPLVDAICAYAIEHPTHGERTIADALARPRFGGWIDRHSDIPQPPHAWSPTSPAVLTLFENIHAAAPVHRPAPGRRRASDHRVGCTMLQRMVIASAQAVLRPSMGA